MFHKSDKHTFAAVVKIGIEPYASISCGAEMHQGDYVGNFYGHKTFKFKKPPA